MLGNIGMFGCVIGGIFVYVVVGVCGCIFDLGRLWYVFIGLLVRIVWCELFILWVVWDIGCGLDCGLCVVFCGIMDVFGNIVLFCFFKCIIFIYLLVFLWGFFFGIWILLLMLLNLFKLFLIDFCLYILVFVFSVVVVFLVVSRFIFVL